MVPGEAWSRWSSKLSIGWTGSIIVVCLSRSEISHLSSTRSYTINSRRLRPWWPDSINQVFGKTGAFQCAFLLTALPKDPSDLLNIGGISQCNIKSELMVGAIHISEISILKFLSIENFTAFRSTLNQPLFFKLI